jgi:hypothetical protein
MSALTPVDPMFVTNAIETLCRRVPSDIHPMSRAYIQEDLCAMHDVVDDPVEVTRLITNVRNRIVREWRWEAEMHANDFHDFREAYKLRRRAERFEASALTSKIDHRRRTMHAWKHALLQQRICEIIGVKFTLRGNDYCNSGAPNAHVEGLIERAISYLETDELKQCERWCKRAERAQIAAIRRLCA